MTSHIYGRNAIAVL